MPRAGRTVVYVVLLIFLLVSAAVRLAPPPSTADDGTRDVTVEQMDATLASLRASIAADPATVIILGDSSFLDHWVLAPEDTLAFLLEHEATAAGLSVRVVAHNGFDPIAYYLLADAVAALRPRAVVLTANLQAFTDAWFRRPRMKHPQLAAYVRPPRVLEAMALPSTSPASRTRASAPSPSSACSASAPCPRFSRATASASGRRWTAASTPA